MQTTIFRPTKSVPYDLRWSGIIVVLAALVEVLVYNNSESVLRTVATILFLIICPGMAFVQLLQIRDIVFELVLAVALSLVMALLVSAVILYAGLWSAGLILGILIGLALIGVTCQLGLWLSHRMKMPVANAKAQ